MSDNDEITRRGAMGLRAEVNSLRREVQTQTERADRAEEDARTLTKFIQGRAGVRVWEHSDVVKVIDALVKNTVERLRVQSKNSALRKTPASHIVYNQMADIMRKEAVEEVKALLDTLSRPDLLSTTMREDLFHAISQGTK